MAKNIDCYQSWVVLNICKCLNCSNPGTETQNTSIDSVEGRLSMSHLIAMLSLPYMFLIVSQNICLLRAIGNKHFPGALSF